MKEGIKNKYPSWISDNKKYNMCLTDDLDSLFSCMLLHKVKGYNITNFYSFDTLYYIDDETSLERLIGVDMDLVEHLCWGNHVTGLNNPYSANLNVIQGINEDNYYTKYCGSVLLQIISYYNIDISMLSDEALMVLLVVDSTYLSYYFNKDTCSRWLVDVLELNPLWDILQRYSKQDFEKVINKYYLKAKIIIDDGYLKTDIDLEGLSKLFNLSFFMPKNRFIADKNFINDGKNTSSFSSYVKDLNSKGIEIFSKAITNKTFVKFSYEIKEKEI